MIQPAMFWTSLSTDDDLSEETPIPGALWFEVYCWLESIPLEMATDRTKYFYDDDLLLMVQLYSGELRYAYGNRPRGWHYVSS